MQISLASQSLLEIWEIQRKVVYTVVIFITLNLIGIIVHEHMLCALYHCRVWWHLALDSPISLI